MLWNRLSPTLEILDVGVKLREASRRDYEQIAALESRYGLDVGSLEQWQHIWRGNPEYRDLQCWTIGWVIEDEKGQIVASIGDIPLSYELAGKRILAVSGRSWVADLPYRSKALSLLDRVINQPNVDLYLNNTRESSFEVLKAFFSQFSLTCNCDVIHAVYTL